LGTITFRDQADVDNGGWGGAKEEGTSLIGWFFSDLTNVNQQFLDIWNEDGVTAEPEDEFDAVVA
jgi:hypothetical protein